MRRRPPGEPVPPLLRSHQVRLPRCCGHRSCLGETDLRRPSFPRSCPSTGPAAPALDSTLSEPGDAGSPDDWPPGDEDVGLAGPLSELYDVWEEGYEEWDDLGGCGGATEEEPPDPGEGPSQQQQLLQQQQQQQQPEESSPPAAPAAPATAGAQGAGGGGTDASGPEAEPPPQPEPVVAAVEAYLCPRCRADLSAFRLLADRAAQVKACMAGKKHTLPKPDMKHKLPKPDKARPAAKPKPAKVPARAAPTVPPRAEPVAEGVKEWLEVRYAARSQLCHCHHHHLP